MQIRNRDYSIEALFSSNDIDFDSITETEQNIIAQYCYRNLTLFKESIDKLIQKYRNSVGNDSETLILNYCDQLNQSIQAAVTQTNDIQKHIEKLSTTNYTANILAEINKLKDNIKTNLSHVLAHNTKLTHIIDNYGIAKLQHQLVFCIIMFLHVPFTVENPKKEDTEAYSAIAKSLAEFWYEEGEKLSPSDNSETNIKVKKCILECLKLFSMSINNDTSTLEKSCYLHILKNEYKRDIEKKINISHFNLEWLARESPDDYKKLHEYLINNHIIYPVKLQQDSNLHIYFKSGLFDLYLSLTS